MNSKFSMPQTVNLELDQGDLESYLVSSGYWETDELRKRNDYMLSPSAYLISESQRLELEDLARSTYAAVRHLSRSLNMLSRGLRHLSHTDGAFLKLANRSTKGLLMPLLHNGTVSPVLKVDLVPDHEGHFFIAEVDAYNPRGLGYLSLLEETVPKEFRHLRFGGVEKLASLIQKFLGENKTLYVIVSEFERYYETAFKIFGKAMEKHGISVVILREGELAAKQKTLPEDVFDLLIIPESLYHCPALREALLGRYKAKTVRTFFPPAAYLGSKAFLPYLRTYEGMKNFLPKTLLLGRKSDASEKKALLEGPSVLKAAVSSGLKQVFFSDLDPHLFEKTLTEVSMLRNPAWILQEQIPQKPLEIMIFDPEGKSAYAFDKYYLRVCAHITEVGILDIEITGRTDRRVHGASDCIQLPSLLAP